MANAIGYKSCKGLQIVDITSGFEDNTVAEGQTVRLTVADSIEGAVPLTYVWRQTAPTATDRAAGRGTGIGRLASPPIEPLDITIPTAIVPPSEIDIPVTLEVTASGDIAGSPQVSTVQLRVTRANNGGAVLAPPIYLTETSALQVEDLAASDCQ